MVPFADAENVAGSRRGTSQNTAATAAESRIALMARHLIVVIPSSPSRVSAQNGFGRTPTRASSSSSPCLLGDGLRTQNCHRTALGPICAVPAAWAALFLMIGQ